MRFWKRRPWLAIVLLALIAGNLLFLAVPGLRYRAIVVHHTASRIGDFRDVRRYHHARGWFEIAYHFVLSNGSTDVGLGHLEPTWRYRLGLWSTATRSWANLTALHVCIVGNYEETDFPKALEGPAGHAIRELQEKYGIPDDRILLHRDCGRTACPGKNLTRERILAWTRKASECPPEVRAQHLRAIGRGFQGAWLLAAVLSLAGLVGLVMVDREGPTLGRLCLRRRGASTFNSAKSAPASASAEDGDPTTSPPTELPGPQAGSAATPQGSLSPSSRPLDDEPA